MGLELYFKKIVKFFHFGKAHRIHPRSEVKPQEPVLGLPRYVHSVCGRERSSAVGLETAVGDIDRTGRDVNQL